MKYLYFCLSLCLLMATAACRQDGAASTDPAPAAAPENTVAAENTPAEDDFTYVPGERFGKLTGATKEGDLEALYGEQIVPVEIHLGEGFVTYGYRLYPDTENTVDITFPDEELGLERLTITMNHKDAKWRMPNSDLTIGTSLAELEKLNGKPFKFYGYEWDYSGAVYDWDGGDLKELGAILSFPEIPDGKMLPDALMGDTEVNSNSPLLEGMKIFVREIIVDLDPPAAGETE